MPPPQPIRWTWIVGLLVGALLTGCSALTSSEPPVADSTLVAVLADLHLVDARADQFADLPPGTRDSILAHYGITPQQFETGIDYYVERPNEYLELYNRVLDHLTEENQRIYELYSAPPDDTLD